jgi:xylan 1,4-beta-xylosidase
VRIVTSVVLAGSLLAQSPSPAPPRDTGDRVDIRVHTGTVVGPMTPFWAFFGYDEPNYTYMRDGTALLTELAALSPVPVYVRTHNLLTSGDGTPALKWGSTNAYTEDAAGRPRYDWTIVDRILDAYRNRGMRPLLELGFMPEALSTHAEPYRHQFAPGKSYGTIFTGWAYPPADYEKWGALIEALGRHVVERYGRSEVERWYFEVWNEPDIGYWQGTPEEFQKLYDFAAAGLRRALPTARIGGPHVTAPSSPRAAAFLRSFLDHALHGTNAATGERGSPLDFVAFHAKGQPRLDQGRVRMGIANHLRAIDAGFTIVKSYTELQNVPVIIGESDPEGCAACSTATNPENAYRNGTTYSSYTAEQLARTYELADAHQVNLVGAVTWAFEFEDQPYFAGFRDLATNGLAKPVLNVFRMLGQMRGDRVAVESSGAVPLEAIRQAGVRERPDVNALAARDDRSVTVLVWNYHDDDRPVPPATVSLAVDGLAAARVRVRHLRVDRDHSNAYTAWQAMGEPQQPDASQLRTLQAAGALQPLEPPREAEVRDGRLSLEFSLPRQGVSLVALDW